MKAGAPVPTERQAPRAAAKMRSAHGLHCADGMKAIHRIVCAVVLGALGLGIAPACGGGSCLIKDCADFGGTSGVKFTKCYSGISPIQTTLEDPKGNVFFDCTDASVTETCTGATVDAEYDYCASASN